MLVFVTGATGWVGSVIVPELISAGHQVIGLARSAASEQKLVEMGAEAVQGDLKTLDVLRSAAKKADGVIHAGFIHDFADLKHSCETDKAAIDAIGEVLIGTNKPFVVTTGMLHVTAGRLATEPDDAVAGPLGFRVLGDLAALALVEKGVRVSLLRLPPSVHGKGEHGFVAALINVAKTSGVSAYPESTQGENRWPSVHRIDAAKAYRLALEKAPAGTTLHVCDEQGVKVKEIAEVIGRRLGVKVESRPSSHFSWLAHFIDRDNPTSSEQTRKVLGWSPTQPQLLKDIEKNYDFPA